MPVVSAASQTTMVPKNRANPDLFAMATASSGVSPFACGTVRTAQHRSASSSAVFSASAGSPSVTATVDQPSSGSSSQRWTGKMETESTPSARSIFFIRRKIERIGGRKSMSIPPPFSSRSFRTTITGRVSPRTAPSRMRVAS